jgi:transposase
MPKSHRPYPPEYRERIIELVRSGRSPESLAREFEPSGASGTESVIPIATRDVDAMG